MDGPGNYLIIIGAPKCGTTSLAAWLGARPDMVLGEEKEPRFFTDFAGIVWQGPAADAFSGTLISSEAQYLASFEGKEGAAWAIDASTDYLWCSAAPERIRDWSRRYRTKLVCILRDPVDRIFSEYQHTVRDHLETETLLRSMELEADRKNANWHPLFYHLTRSLYHRKLRRYEELFGSDLMVMDFSELRDPTSSMGRITDFLGLPRQDVAQPDRKNESFVYRNALAAGVMGNDRLKAIARGIVPPSVRRPVRKSLEALLGRKYQRAPQEISVLREMLGEEILACGQYPLIDTGGWVTSGVAAGPGATDVPGGVRT